LSRPTVISSNWNVFYGEILFYICLEKVNKRRGDGTAAGGSTFQTDLKKLGELQRKQKVDALIDPIFMERSMD